jgi:hypothetical protein
LLLLLLLLLLVLLLLVLLLVLLLLIVLVLLLPMLALGRGTLKRWREGILLHDALALGIRRRTIPLAHARGTIGLIHERVLRRITPRRCGRLG